MHLGRIKNSQSPCATSILGGGRRGFTLAEVAVVILILSIIAILTVPALIQSYQKKQTVVRLKRAYTTLSSAVGLLRFEEPIASKTYRGWNRAAAMNFWKDYGFSKIKLSKICDGISAPATECFGSNLKTIAGNNFSWYKSGTYFSFILSDGTAVSSTFGDGGTYMVNFVDINGLNPPNQLGKDIFRISCDFAESSRACTLSGSQNERETCLADCSKTNSSNRAGFSCGGLIVVDGWEIKDDYPW